MCLACEMFWMVAEEEPPQPPKRRARKAKAPSDAGFACDEPATLNAGPAKTARPRASRSRKRAPRVESERLP
jgi:hypothetical protein